MSCQLSILRVESQEWPMYAYILRPGVWRRISLNLLLSCLKYRRLGHAKYTENNAPSPQWKMHIWMDLYETTNLSNDCNFSSQYFFLPVFHSGNGGVKLISHSSYKPQKFRDKISSSTQGQYIFPVRQKILLILRHWYQNLRYILNGSWRFYTEVQLFLQIAVVFVRVSTFRANCP